MSQISPKPYAICTTLALKSAQHAELQTALSHACRYEKGGYKASLDGEQCDTVLTTDNTELRSVVAHIIRVYDGAADPNLPPKDRTLFRKFRLHCCTDCCMGCCIGCGTGCRLDCCTFADCCIGITCLPGLRPTTPMLWLSARSLRLTTLSSSAL